MSTIHIMTVVGARPQFIKAAVVSRAIANANANGLAPSVAIQEEIIHTGQHYDYAMSQSFFEEMDIPQPAANLKVGSGRHGEVTGAMLAGLEREMLERRPDLVLVYGDTNSTLAGALAAVKLHIPVAHVEAGLRSFNMAMPEEINRLLTDRIATYLFCPSAVSQAHLVREGRAEGVYVVGDVMYDAARYYAHKARPPQREGPFVVASLHRAENTDDPQRLKRILAALEQSPMPVYLPLHPRTRRVMQDEGIQTNGALQLCEPFSYFDMLGHLQQCDFVITDSGGMQKEAYYFGKKCVTVRDETEWTELVEVGVNRVVGAEETASLAAFEWAVEPLPVLPRLYGNGLAGEAIIEVLTSCWQFSDRSSPSLYKAS
jgi:UDP-GlcNAc3NAcA epimerase